MANYDATLKQQSVTIQNLERQVGQLAKQLLERPPGSLPGNTIVNPKETAMAIQLRSGKVLEESQVMKKDEEIHVREQVIERDVEQSN